MKTIIFKYFKNLCLINLKKMRSRSEEEVKAWKSSDP